MAHPHAEALFAAHARLEGLPALPAGEVSLDDAYAIQRDYVGLRLADGERIAGFKAAATTAAAREQLDAPEPLFGVLFAGGERHHGARVGLSAFSRCLVETELGFTFSSSVSRPVAGAELPALIDQVLPVVELADPDFADPAAMNAAALVAAGVASAQFVVGRAEARPADVNAVDIVFTRDGAEVHRGSARDSFGDQWLALEWLVARAVGEGYRIEPGQVLITGSLGQVQPGLPGAYRADYAGLGRVAFDLR